MWWNDDDDVDDNDELVNLLGKRMIIHTPMVFWLRSFVGLGMYNWIWDAYYLVENIYKFKSQSLRLMVIVVANDDNNGWQEWRI